MAIQLSSLPQLDIVLFAALNRIFTRSYTFLGQSAIHHRVRQITAENEEKGYPDHGSCSAPLLHHS
jgi:hypothetical protein